MSTNKFYTLFKKIQYTLLSQRDTFPWNHNHLILQSLLILFQKEKIKLEKTSFHFLFSELKIWKVEFMKIESHFIYIMGYFRWSAAQNFKLAQISFTFSFLWKKYVPKILGRYLNK